MQVTYTLSDPSKLLPTFDSLTVPKQKLSGLLDLITRNPNLFFGES